MGKITVEGLTKTYKCYQSRFQRLKEWLVPFKSYHTDKNVLNDISFSVEAGKAVGIVGINGAGKSTLLKLITGISKPTAGSVKIEGSVSALLELGMGFHPEFTGRQNAVMASQLLGMTKKDIEKLMPSIIEFAEIGEYIDQPLRVYSSGMQMRLAFSVATAVRPDVLIVDEALSVGDTYFQHKSFSKIREFREQGTTLLIVSHEKQVIQSICDTAILINGGKLELEGSPEFVMNYYNALLADSQKKNTKIISNVNEERLITGTGKAKLSGCKIIDNEGSSLDVVGCGQKVKLQVDTIIDYDLDDFVVGYSIKDRLGQVVFGTNTYFLNGCKGESVKHGEKLRYIFEFDANLGPGSYSLSIAVHEGENHVSECHDWVDRALVFNVINFEQPNFEGNSWIPQTLEAERI
ncbi:ATP binding component of ABC-transporter [Grimontia indica]|uniref:ATP binding component of ABC-transporter n=1 Tax=Grimontia indica TaxID=1056512 RepID=R1IXS8_9GAMM|nr:MULTISPECIES: ABC transporter ATP-binding protein [Grimontia]EOD80120.1 ATP binding component of ABC-transporter [Grimontia indica]